MDRFIFVPFVLYLYYGGLEVIITPSYARYYVLSGAQLQLNCSHSGQTGELRWYKGDINLNSDNDTRLTISNETSGGWTHSTLTYTSADTTMSGNYTCKLEGSGLSQQSEITVEVISITTADAQFQSGKNAFLRCQTPEPVGVIVWMKDKTPVKNLKPTENTTYVEHSNGTLEIQNPTLDSIAVYTCTVQIQDATNQSLEVPVMLYTQLGVLALENSTNVLLRDSVEITCMVEGKPSPSVTWLKNGTELKLDADSRYNVSEVEDSNQDRLNFTLHIAVVDWEDAGNYTCLASRSTALSDNASMTIEVIVRGLVTIAPSYARYYVLSGAQLQLNCSNPGQTGELRWYKGNINLNSDNDTRLTISNETSGGWTHSTLTYTSVDSSMSGNYTCKLEGSGLSQQSEITVDVISITTADAQFQNGTDAFLRCQTPEPVGVIVWMKDKTPVKNLKPTENTTYVEHRNGTLEIQNPTLDSIAVYTCTVQIQDATNQSLEVPVVLYTQLGVLALENSTTVLLRDSVEITCMVEGKPSPSVTWLKNGTELELGADSRYHVSEVEDSNQGRLNVTLHIAFADWEDAGNYTCLASRSTALSDNASMTIKVIVRGGLEAAVTIEPSYARYYVLSGAQLQLNCSNPGQTGELRWYKGDTNLNSDDTRLTISNETSGGMIYSTLTYTSADRSMSGEYKCQLEGGEVGKQGTITVEVISITTTDATFVNLTVTKILQCQTTDALNFIFWTKDETPVKDLNETGRTRYVDHGNGTLEILKPTRDIAGVYVCRYSDKNKMEVEKNVTLYAGPYVLPFQANVSLTEQGRVELLCRVLGYPRPISITWFKDDIEINMTEERELNESHYNFSEAEGYSNARLVIESVVIEDHGNYTCRASNGSCYGEKWVLVRVRGKLAPLWPLLGILVQVILLAVIISVSEKRRKRKEMAEDRSTTSSSVRVKPDTSSSLRHRGRQSKVDPQETSDAVTKL